MKSVIFCFATHNHQPIGNFDNIIEEAYEKSYRPFIEIAERFPIKFGTHFTGILLDWLQAHHPEHIAKLKIMVERGQVEMITGGFNEPILSVIPRRDQESQLRMLRDRIQADFNYDAKTLWLAERVWEQSLASTLHDSGARAVLLDDTHFLAAGLREDELNGYYLTEDNGKPIAVFPISKALRYTIPFAPVDETLRVLQDAASESGNNIVTFADDGEKFGVWPKTYEHVYGEGWLEELFAKLAENASWVKMMHVSEVLKQVPPIGRIYLPSGSYAEMMQWALPTAKVYQEYDDFLHKLDEDKEKWEMYRPFVRGGFWRNFFVKYPEANHLHKHALRSSERLAAIEASQPPSESIESARRHLLASQCNDVYWHGVFGGIYLANLRHANYTSLITADREIDALEQLASPRVTHTDFDTDGRDELIIETDHFSLYVSPEVGGAITEMDFKPRAFNATNTIVRREEAYHAKITNAARPTEAPIEAASADRTATEETPAEKTAPKSIHDEVLSKEEGLDKLLIYDWYRHGSMMEHIISDESTVEDGYRMQFREQADFLTGKFEPEWAIAGNELALRQVRSGMIAFGEQSLPVRLEKTLKLAFGSRDMEVTYVLKNDSSEAFRCRFGSEWTFNLLAGDAPDRNYKTSAGLLEHSRMKSIGAIESASDIELIDEWLKLGIKLDLNAPAEIWRFPLESVSLSEAGFERVYQGSVVMPIWELALEPGQEWHGGLTVRFEERA